MLPAPTAPSLGSAGVRCPVEEPWGPPTSQRSLRTSSGVASGSSAASSSEAPSPASPACLPCGTPPAENRFCRRSLGSLRSQCCRPPLRASQASLRLSFCPAAAAAALRPCLRSSEPSDRAGSLAGPAIARRFAALLGPIARLRRSRQVPGSLPKCRSEEDRLFRRLLPASLRQFVRGTGATFRRLLARVFPAVALPAVIGGFAPFQFGSAPCGALPIRPGPLPPITLAR